MSTAFNEGEFRHGLAHFTGTELWHRTIIPTITYTDGAKYVADKCGAYWLLDDIALHQAEPAVKKEEFQVWILRVDLAKSKAVLSCEDGNDNEVFKVNIPFTDFPLCEFKLWYTNRVIMLPSEY